MHLLLGGSYQSVVAMDTDINDGQFTVGGLSADTNYTLSVAAVGIAGQSHSTILINITTDSDTLNAWLITAVAAAAAFVPIILAFLCLRIRYVFIAYHFWNNVKLIFVSSLFFMCNFYAYGSNVLVDSIGIVLF